MKPGDLDPAQYAWRRRGGGAGDAEMIASLSKPTVSAVPAAVIRSEDRLRSRQIIRLLFRAAR